MMTDDTPQPSGLFGVYLQTGDLDRSLSFYRDVLKFEVVWNDGTLAILHGRQAPADSLVIREIGQAVRPSLGEAGVTRVLWRAGDPGDLDRAEELLTRQQVPYQRHRDGNIDGITMRDPDGLEVALLWMGVKGPGDRPPSWLYWKH
jgi:catechol 2,3-dioxygenase-like lactoylglutathione lyase family enzyme